MRYNIKFQDIVKKLNQNSKYLFMVSYYKSEYTINIINSDNEIMAIKHKIYPIYGLQFHPESILTPDGMKILKNFFEGELK